MKTCITYLLFILLVTSAARSSAQKLTSNSLLEKVYAKLQKARDYSVKAEVRIDIPFIKALPNKATLFFKQKDKFKVESKGISIIPRQGFNQLSRILHDSTQYICVEQGYDMIDSIQTAIVNVISLSDTSDLILGKLWIDTKHFVVLQSQLTTRSNGTIFIEYKYGSQLKYGLPDRLIFTLDVKKFKIPKVLGADINTSAPEKNADQRSVKKGKVFITLKDYQINKGIPDSFFDKKK